MTEEKYKFYPKPWRFVEKLNFHMPGCSDASSGVTDSIGNVICVLPFGDGAEGDTYALGRAIAEMGKVIEEKKFSKCRGCGIRIFYLESKTPDVPHRCTYPKKMALDNATAAGEYFKTLDYTQRTGPNPGHRFNKYGKCEDCNQGASNCFKTCQAWADHTWAESREKWRLGIEDCTWTQCLSEALHSELDKDGKEWANLCNKHHDMLEDSIKSGDASKIMKAWIRPLAFIEALVNKMMGY